MNTTDKAKKSAEQAKVAAKVAAKEATKSSILAMKAQASCMGWGNDPDLWPEPNRQQYEEALRWLEQH